MGHKQSKNSKEKQNNISGNLNEENNDMNEEEEEVDDIFSTKKSTDKKKKLKDFDKTEIKKLQNTFLGFRCQKCLKQLELKINIKENQEINILFECENKDHSNESTLRNLLEKNRIEITPDYKVIDNFYSKRKKDKKHSYRDYMHPEYFLICTECKTIFYTREKGIGNINHKHTLINYLYLGCKDDDICDYNPEENVSLERREYFNLDSFNYLNLQKKIKGQKKFYSKLIEFQNKEKNIDISEYISLIKDEIDFINVILKAYLNSHNKVSYNNIKLLFNISLSTLPEKYMNNEEIKDFVQQNYKDENIKYIDNKIIPLNNYTNISINKKIEYACKINEKFFATIGEEITIFEIKQIYNFKEVINIKERGDYISYIRDQKLLSCDLIQGKINIYQLSNNFDSYEIIQTIQNHSNLDICLLFKDNNFVYSLNGKFYFYTYTKKKQYSIMSVFDLNIKSVDKKSKIIESLIEIDKINICFIYQSEIYFHNRKNNKTEKKISLSIIDRPRNDSPLLLKDNILCYITYREDNINFIDLLTFKVIQSFRTVFYTYYRH